MKTSIYVIQAAFGTTKLLDHIAREHRCKVDVVTKVVTLPELDRFGEEVFRSGGRTDALVACSDPLFEECRHLYGIITLETAVSTDNYPSAVFTYCQSGEDALASIASDGFVDEDGEPIAPHPFFIARAA